MLYVILNWRTFGGTLTYRAGQRDDPLHLLALGDVGRVQEHRVPSLRRLRGVKRVAVHEAVCLVRNLFFRGPAAQALR